MKRFFKTLAIGGAVFGALKLLFGNRDAGRKAARVRLEGNWDQVKGRIKQSWGSLSDQDLVWAEGSWDRLVGVIKGKTGESAKAIEKRLSRLSK
ncbi:MAG: CsbD family protein [Actinomycetota bacterium]|nr:CsbD family protein [Actinomycetota bacterium]